MPLTARSRRWIRRVIYTLLGVPAAAALILLIYIHTGRPDEMARERLAAAIEAYLGHPVTIQSVELRYLPPGLIVNGFRSEHPLIEASRMEVAVSLRALLRGRLVIKDVDLFEPLIEWHLDTERLRQVATGPPVAAPGEEPPASKVDLRRVRLHHARILIGSEIRELTAEIEGLRLQADNQDPGYKGPWTGSLVFSRGRFLLGDLEIEGVTGSLAFEADPTSIHARRVTLKAEGIDIRGTGQIQPGTPLRGRFEADARLDPQSPDLKRPLPQLTAKNFNCTLAVTLPGDGMKVSGTFTAQEPAFDPDRVPASDGRIVDGSQPPWTAAQGTGTLLVEPGRIEVKASLADLVGGHVEAGYTGVLHGTGDQTSREHQLTISATQLNLEEVLRHFELPGRQEIMPSAFLSGEAEMTWEAGKSDQMKGSSELLFDRATGALPVWGAATVAWHGRRFTVESSSLKTEGSDVKLSGTFDATTEHALDMKAHLVSTDTIPLAAFLEQRFPALGAAKISPTNFSGQIESDMIIRGTTARPVVDATFSTTGIVVVLPTASIPLQSASGSVSYRSDLVALELPHLEGADLSARGSLKANPATGVILAADFVAETIPAGLLSRLAGIDPEKLTATGIMRAEGSYDGDEGRFELSSDALSLGQLPLSDLKTRGRLIDKQLHLDEGSVIFCDGKVTAQGVVDFAGTSPRGGLEFSIEAVDLATVDEKYPGPSLTGLFGATGRLTLGETTRLDASISASDVHIAGMDRGRITGTLAGTFNSDVDPLHLELKDERGAVTSTASLSAGGQLSGLINVHGFNLDEIRPLVPPSALRGLAGETDGVITFNGPLREPASMHVVAVLEHLRLTVGDDTLTSEEPVRLTIQDGFLTMAPMRLLGTGTNLTLGGSMTLSGTYDITARVAGTYDLSLAEVLVPEMSATGTGEADLHVTERGDILTYEGTLTLDHGRIRHPSLPMPLENLRGRSEFSELGKLSINELLFDTGGGHVSGTGFVKFEGIRVPEIHLALVGKGVSSELFPEMRAFFDADITIDKRGDSYELGGQVMIQRAIYTRAFGVAPSDLLLRGREFAPARETHGEVPEMRLGIDIDAERDVWIRNDDALIEASAHLRLEGTMNKPELSGRVSALEGGTYRFRDVTYNIVGGSVDFADLTRIDPLIDIEASTRVQSYEITLRITGRYSRPTFELTSDPPLPQRDVVWLLITGHTIDEDSSSATANVAAEGQVAAYLAAPVAGAVSAPIGRYLGVSSFSIDPYFLNGSADPSARVTVTKRLEQGLLFTYSSSLGQSGQEVYQIEYNPGRIWDLIATRDMDGSVGADLRFRRRWKGFNKPPPLTAGELSPIEFELARPKIGTVEIVTDHLVASRRSLLRKLPFDEGDSVRRGDLLEGRETLRQLYIKSGYPAAKVDLIEEPAGTPDAPRLNVSYAVRSGARHELQIHTEVQERGIRNAALQAWQDPILLEDLAAEARKAALRLLKSKGYYAATVDASGGATQDSTYSEENPAIVTLDVASGSKVMVKEINITGNSAMSEERIRRQLLTRKGGLMTIFGKGKLKEAVLEEDVNAVRGLYLANGYLTMRIAEPKVTLSADGREAEITIQITEEGPQSRVGDIVIEGEAPGVSNEMLIKATQLSRTQVLTAGLVSSAEDRVREALDERGYSRARVSSSISGPAEQTRVVFTIIPFDRARIRDVTITGNTRTRGRIVEREIKLNRGDYLSRTALLDTQKNLYRLGTFRSVQIDTKPVEDKPGFVDVMITVQEGSPILTAWGIGYDTEDLVRGTFEIANNNLFGTRRSAGLFVRESAREKRLQVTMRDPNLFGEKIESLLSAFREREESESFDQRRLGVSTQLIRDLGELTKHRKIFVRYLLEDIHLFNVEVSEDEIDEKDREVRLGSFGVSLVHDTRNDIINPTKGGLASIDYRIYHQVFASQSQFARLYVSKTNFADLGHRMVWAASARIGLLTSKDIPITERFFAGGDTTLRGFEYEKAGPVEYDLIKDPKCGGANAPCPHDKFDLDTGNPIGGNVIFLLNQELRFPLYKALRGVIFYDSGNVFATLEDFDLSDARDVVGGGFRFDTPVGPFRIEYGHKLDRKPRESHGEFFFSIGQAF